MTNLERRFITARRAAITADFQKLNPRQQETIKQPVELMVSSETKGGSVSKQPTGPTVYQGALAIR